MRRIPSSILTATLLAVALAACGGGDDGAGIAEQADGRAEALSRSPGHKLPPCSLPAATAPLTAITSVQGPGAASPIVGQTVTVRGVVTADWRGSERLNGFFIQQPDPDQDPSTSEGLFVFAPAIATPLSVGDYVQIEGRVTEFRRAGESESLTQIANPAALEVCGPTRAIKPTTLTLPLQDVDVQAVLRDMAAKKGGGGNYKESIVDLLKLLDLDSSLEERKQLAQELGVNAGAHGSAEQNIALHKAVLKKLAENGGKVPDSLKD